MALLFAETVGHSRTGRLFVSPADFHRAGDMRRLVERCPYCVVLQLGLVAVDGFDAETAADAVDDADFFLSVARDLVFFDVVVGFLPTWVNVCSEPAH